ncbi:MAG: hypothetical protein KDB36_07555 [Acidimicrobiales bacterium]|nr:hypothetical protein [Acidimicrobiales bacterium]
MERGEAGVGEHHVLATVVLGVGGHGHEAGRLRPPHLLAGRVDLELELVREVRERRGLAARPAAHGQQELVLARRQAFGPSGLRREPHEQAQRVAEAASRR